MKVGAAIIALFFYLFAAVQFNDLDPWAWVIWYGFVGSMGVVFLVGRLSQWTLLLGLGIGLIWAATLVPAVLDWIRMGTPNIAGDMKATQPHIELTREFFGLLLSLLSLLLIYIWNRRSKKL